MIDVAEAYNGGLRDFWLRASESNGAGHDVIRERGVRFYIPKGMTRETQILLVGKGALGVESDKACALYEGLARETQSLMILFR